MIRSRGALAAILIAGLGVGPVLAQSYPTKPVRIVAPYPPGGLMDAMLRSIIAPKITEAWNERVLIENRSGAGGNVGTAVVARAAPDGYTFLMTTSGHVISPALYRQLPFDPVKDFDAVTQVSSTYLMMVVHSSVPAASVKEFIALVKSQPGQLNYGSSGVGATPHLAMELFKLATGTNTVHVAYSGNGPADAALLANVVQVAIAPLPGVLPMVKAGKLRALAVTGTTRSPSVPDVPTMAEAGVPDYVFTGWFGIYAPAGTPLEIRRKLQAEIAKIVALPEIKAQFRIWGNEPVGSTPEEFDAFTKTEIIRHAKIIKEANIPQQN